jgi:hypothetical protein
LVTPIQFNEYLDGRGEGSLILFAPASTQLKSVDLQVNLLDFLREGAILTGVSGWYVAGFDYGSEYGNSSDANYTLATRKLALYQMLQSPKH